MHRKKYNCFSSFKTTKYSVYIYIHGKTSGFRSISVKETKWTIIKGKADFSDEVIIIICLNSMHG